MTDRTQVVLSLGMGVESVAIALRWMHEPDTCPCSLEDLIVVTSQTGNEYEDTGRDMTAHVLPLFRQHGIRYVQLARHGMHASDGYTVLSDTRQPDEIFLKGDFTLLDYQRINGTVPQFGGEHKCSIKFKADVIEPWLHDHVRATTIRHAFGYNVDEQTRIQSANEGIAKRQAKAQAKAARERAKALKLALEGATRTDVAFGFNVDEQVRIERSREYDTVLRIGLYPLNEWGWSRQDCIDYIQSKTGIQWRKSACVFCPFAHNKQSLPDLIARHKEHAPQVGDALTLERMSLSLNHRGQLYSESTLIQLTVASGNMAALANAETQLLDMEWGVYRVRRIYTAPGTADRAVERIETHATREGAEDALMGAASDMGRAAEFVHQDILRVSLRTREEDVYPSREEFLVAAPAYAMDKCRDMDFAKFELKWIGEYVPARKRKAA